MFDLTLSTLVMRILAALPIIGLHGFALALGARLLGDQQAHREGRLTISPFSHLDPVGLLAFILLGIGWILPIPMSVKRMRGQYLAIPLVLAAGLLPVMLLAALAVYLLPWAAVSFSYSTAPLVGAFLAVLARLSIGFVIFNLLPFPPFSLGQILAACSDEWRAQVRRFQTPLGIIALVAGFLLLPWITGSVNAVVRSVFGNITMLLRSSF